MAIEIRRGKSPEQSMVETIQILDAETQDEENQLRATNNPYEQEDHENLAKNSRKAANGVSAVLAEYIVDMTDTGFGYIVKDIERAFKDKPTTGYIAPMRTVTPESQG